MEGLLPGSYVRGIGKLQSPTDMKGYRWIKGLRGNGFAKRVEDLSKYPTLFEAGNDRRPGGEPETFKGEVAGAPARTAMPFE